MKVVSLSSVQGELSDLISSPSWKRNLIIGVGHRYNVVTVKDEKYCPLTTSVIRKFLLTLRSFVHCL